MAEATYVFRFFFDWGTCLWSANDAARREFGYPVAHERIGLSPDLVLRIDDAVTQHQSSIDLDDPAGPSPWTAADFAAFKGTTDELLADLRAELGSTFSILDERSDFEARL